MTDSKLRALVTEAVLLDREIADKKERLAALKEQLTSEAAGREEQAVKTDGGGTSTTLEGEDGCIARVTIAGDTLKSSVEAEAKTFPKIKAAAGRFFSELFTPGVIYTPVDQFRDRAVLLLGREAKPLIKLMETKGRTSVAFETKDKAAA